MKYITSLKFFAIVVCQILLTGQLILLTGQTKVTKDDSTQTVLKFDVCSDYLVTIPVKINSKEYVFLLDTGSNRTVLDESVPNIEYIDLNETVSSVNATVKVKTATVGSLEIGNQNIKDTEVISLDLGFIKKHCPQVRGVLGNDILSKFNYAVDYNSKKVVISKSEIAFDMSDSVAFTEIDQRMLLKVKIESVEKLFVFDTSASNILEFVDTNFDQTNASLTDHAGQSKVSVKRVGLQLGRSEKTTIMGQVYAKRDENGLFAARLLKRFYVNNSNNLLAFSF